MPGVYSEGMKYKTIRVVDHEATGAYWRKRREKNAISLRALALQMECSAPFLSDLERGRRNWSKDTEDRYRNALGHLQGNLQGTHQGIAQGIIGHSEGGQPAPPGPVF